MRYIKKFLRVCHGRFIHSCVIGSDCYDNVANLQNMCAVWRQLLLVYDLTVN